MSDSKGQGIIVIGIALIAIGIVLYYYSNSLPSAYKVESNTVAVATTASENNVINSKATFSASISPESSKNSNDSEAYTYPINLNNCTMEELVSISGIGEAKASAILEYRDYLGGYTSVEQIKNIKGIGDGLYARISPYLTV